MLPREIKIEELTYCNLLKMKNSDSTKDYLDLEFISKHKDIKPSYLKELSTHKHPQILLNVANNPSTTEDTLLSMFGMKQYKWVNDVVLQRVGLEKVSDYCEKQKREDKLNLYPKNSLPLMSGGEQDLLREKTELLIKLVNKYSPSYGPDNLKELFEDIISSSKKLSSSDEYSVADILRVILWEISDLSIDYTFELDNFFKEHNINNDDVKDVFCENNGKIYIKDVMNSVNLLFPSKEDKEKIKEAILLKFGNIAS